MADSACEPILVQSPDNDRYRTLMTLSASSRERRKQQRTVIESDKLIGAFLDAQFDWNAQMHAIFFSERLFESVAGKKVLRRLSDRQTRVVVLADGLFKAASQLATPAGPIAIIDTPRLALPEQFTNELVYLDGVQDPGNIGTIIRTCAAAGIKTLITSSGSAFCWAPKVLRAAMGGHFALQLFEGIEPSEFRSRLAPTLVPRALVASSDGQSHQELHATDLTAPSAWLFGSEGMGLRAQTVTKETQRLTIKHQPDIESLNVATAVAVCLFETRRQRGV